MCRPTLSRWRNTTSTCTDPGEETAVISDDREIRLGLERLDSRLHTQHVLRAIGQTRHKILIAQIDIHDFRRENDMGGLVERHFQSVRGNHAVKTDLPRQTLKLISVGVAGSVHVDVVFLHLLSVGRHIVIGVFG